MRRLPLAPTLAAPINLVLCARARALPPHGTSPASSYPACSTLMKRTPLLVLLLALLTGCISTSTVPLDGAQRAPIHPDEVTIYLDAADVPAGFEKVAIIYAEGDHAATDQARLFKKVRKEAARVGANGVLIQQVKEPGTAAKVAQVVLGLEADRQAEMIAIYVPPATTSN